MKNQAIRTQSASQQIIADHTISTASIEAAGKLPTVASLKKCINGNRNANISAPANPFSLLTLEIPETYSKTSRDESFLLYDTGSRED